MKVFGGMEDIQRGLEIDPNSGNYESWLKHLNKLDEDGRRKAIDAVPRKSTQIVWTSTTIGA